ncbi:Uma2 family endonuclease [Benzoatithermus flavus]|uniref:Uma2 family endonuclease n=1 Tax=Benzoatithermus flavus TaxID=3108223 RepID=A0ABU8XR39_9PROT
MAQPQPIYPEIRDIHEFRDWLHGREGRFEFVDGRIVPMAGASRAHNDIQVNLILAIGPQLRGGPCRVNGPDLLVRTAASGRRGRLPDASITCEPEIDPYFVSRPVALFEILSPETEARDRGEKWQEYQSLPSLQHYVLIAQDHVRVEHYRRIANGWHYQELCGRDAVLQLDPPGIELRLADLYEAVSLVGPEPSP